ncbi:MAG: hypothetical protein VX257_02970 [Planctomycetota bacterium]|nr:hypothetical protein [Planctomycetota bacterium]
MAKRKRGGGPEVSLFPFLSILACVIGTLTLMIAALALGQMDNPAIESIENFQNAENQLAIDNAAIETLKRQIEEARSDTTEKNRRLVALQDELSRLKAEVARLRALPAPTADIPQQEFRRRKDRVTELLADIKQLDGQIKKLLDDLRRLDAPPEEAVVKIQPGGSGTNLNPTFVECAASRIIIYQDGAKHPVRRADLKKDAVFLNLLEQVAESERDTIVFLVRDDAISTYFSARNVARSKYARNGKLPVTGHGKIDLSLFTKKS